MSDLRPMLTFVNQPQGPRTARLAGIITTAELRALGKSVQEIKTLAAKGVLIHLRQGVYLRTRFAKRYQGDSGEYLLRLGAALVAAGPDAVVSHQSAARLMGIDLLGRARDKITLTWPAELGWRGMAGICFYATTLPAQHVSTRTGVPCTTAARTVVDLARVLEFKAGVVAADSALHRKLATKAEMLAVIDALPRRRGISRARAVVEFADGRAESPLESLARVLFAALKLPPPDLQVWVGGPQPAGRVDFFWREYRTVAEVDGALKYSNPERAREQLRRDSALRAEGYEVVHFTWQDINFNHNLVAAELRKAFERGAAIQARLPHGQAAS
jgi:predicted transcriptional regulator of viral defense system